MLENYNLNEIEALVQKAEAMESRLGRRPTKRELIAGVRGIKNGAMANFILEVIVPKHPQGSDGVPEMHLEAADPVNRHVPSLRAA